MTPISPDLGRMIARSGGDPVEIFDPESSTVSLLVREHEFVLLRIDLSGEFTNEEALELM